MRLSTLPTAFGEKLVMRIFDPEVVVKTLPELSFPIHYAARWDALTQRHHPGHRPDRFRQDHHAVYHAEGAGDPQVNVCTVEDPIEIVEAAFNQMQVQHGIDLSFADGIRALMRQDPDIIMVGEIRDLATAEMAIQAALTGHLVLSTLHTNNAPSAVMRLLELGVPYYLLESTLIGIMAQRLMRTLCIHCKSADGTIEKEIWDKLSEGSALAQPATVYRAVGCPECRQTGYRGRTGLYELLTVTQTFSKLIREQTDIHQLRRQASADGMNPLHIAGALKIIEGMTTAEEVRKVTSSMTA